MHNAEFLKFSTESAFSQSYSLQHNLLLSILLLKLRKRNHESSEESVAIFKLVNFFQFVVFIYIPMPLVQTPINTCHYSEIVHLHFSLMAFSEFRIQVHNIALQGNSSPNTVCYFPFVMGYWEWKLKSWACNASTIPRIHASPRL